MRTVTLPMTTRSVFHSILISGVRALAWAAHVVVGVPNGWDHSVLVKDQVSAADLSRGMPDGWMVGVLATAMIRTAGDVCSATCRFCGDGHGVYIVHNSK